jgi:endoglycosylceramidase
MGELISTDLCKYFDQLEVTSKLVNIQHMKIGGFMTEYGAYSNSIKSAKEITILTDPMQEYLRCWTYWQFKYYSHVTTKARPVTTESFYNMDGSLQENKVRALVRPYAYVIWGSQLRGS